MKDDGWVGWSAMPLAERRDQTAVVWMVAEKVGQMEPSWAERKAGWMVDLSVDLSVFPWAGSSAARMAAGKVAGKAAMLETGLVDRRAELTGSLSVALSADVTVVW